MSWQKTRAGVVGAARDHLTDGILAFVEEYEEDLSRRPTAAELLQSLADCIDALGHEIEGLENSQIKEVRLVTKKLAPVADVEIGTVLRGKLSDKYFYCRAIAKNDNGTLLEFYRTKSAWLSFSALTKKENKVSMVCYVDIQSLMKTRNWKPIGNLPVAKGTVFPDFFLIGGMLHSPGRKKSVRATVEQVKKCVPLIVFSGPNLERSLQQYGFRVWPEVRDARNRCLKTQFPNA